MIEHEALECVAVVAADSVGSMDSDAFLHKADNIWTKYHSYQQQQTRKASESNIPVMEGELFPSPAIPHGYDKVTEYQMNEFGITRDQLRMAVSLESFHAGMHPESLFYKKHRKKDKSLINYLWLMTGMIVELFFESIRNFNFKIMAEGIRGLVKGWAWKLN